MQNGVLLCKCIVNKRYTVKEPHISETGKEDWNGHKVVLMSSEWSHSSFNVCSRPLFVYQPVVEFIH